MVIILRKIKNKIIFLLSGIWAVPSVLLLRSLSSLFLVRLNTFSHLRIGDFVLETGLYLGELKEQPANTVDLFWLPKGNCNAQWEKMTRRSLPNVRDWVGSLYKWNNIIKGGEQLLRPPRLGDQDKEGLFYRYNLKIPFLPEEEKFCKDWFKNQGWKEGEPFVCLLVRDSAYLANDPLHGNGDKASYKRWEYHNYRDTKIFTYLKAMEWLADQDVWVLRMGKIMSEPLKSNHYKIIDYSFHPEKNDLLDIWFFANSTGCISTSTGIDSVSHLYGIPMLFVNQMAFRHLKTSHHSITIPKHHIWTENKNKLKLKEIFSINSTNSITLRDEGVGIVDLDEDEILTAVKEYWLRLMHKWVDNDETNLLQKKFWSWWDRNNPKLFDKTYHGWVHPDSRVGTDWLKAQNKDFFEDIA